MGRARRGCGALRVRAPKGAGHKGAPAPCGCLICIARRVRARKGLGSEGAPEPCGRWFPSTRRVRAPRGVGVEGRARARRAPTPSCASYLVISESWILDTAKFDVSATFFDFYVTVSGCGCFPQKVTVRVFGFVVKNGDCRNRCKRNKIANCQRFQTRDVSDGGQGGTRQNGGSRRLCLQEYCICMHACTFMKHLRAYLFALICTRARAANARAMPCSMYACARA